MTGNYEWMARLSASCFVGQALKWYAGLDSKTQDDWRLLEIALLKEYTSSESDVEKESNTMKTLAAPPPIRRRSLSHPALLERTLLPSPRPPFPPPAPPFAWPPRALVTGISGLCAGRIKVVGGFPQDRYITQSMSTKGHYWAEPSKARALKVYVPLKPSPIETFEIRLVDGDLLGFQWRTRKIQPASWGKLVRLTLAHSNSTALSYAPPLPLTSSSHDCDGDFTGTIWHFGANNSLEASIMNQHAGLEAREPFLIGLNLAHQIFLTLDWSSYTAEHPGDFRGCLIFEPI